MIYRGFFDIYLGCFEVVTDFYIRLSRSFDGAATAFTEGAAADLVGHTCALPLDGVGHFLFGA